MRVYLLKNRKAKLLCIYLKVNLLLRKLLVGATFFGGASLCGQTKEFIFTKYGPSEGLPSAEVYAVHQDSDGFIWICTDRGISRYDGYSFKNYNTATKGISNNTVFAAYEIGNEIWFICYDGSIFTYDKLKKEFQRLELSNNTNKYGWVSNIYFKKKDIYIYYTSYVNKVAKIDRATGKLTNMDVDSLEPVFRVKEGVIEYTMYKELPMKMLVVNRSNQAYRIKKVIYRGGQIITFYKNKLLVFDNEKKIKEISFKQEILGIKLINNQLFVYGKNGFFLIGKDYSYKAIMSNYSVTNFIKDYEGNFWICTLHNGLFKLTSINKSTLNIGLKKNERVLCFKNFGKHLIMGSSAGRYFVYNKNSSDIIKSYTIPKQYRISNLYINGNKVSINNQVVLYEKGGKIVSQPTNSSYHVNTFFIRGKRIETSYSEGYTVSLADTNVSSEIQNAALKERVLSVEFKDSTEVYLATFRGLFQTSYNNLLHPKQVHPNKIPKIRINKVYIKNNYVFVATSGEGAYCIYNNTVFPVKGLSSTIINSFALAGDSLLYVASNRGVDKLKIINKDTLQFKFLESYNSKNHLVSDYVYDLTVFDNNIYYSSDVGLAKLPIRLRKKSDKAPKLIVYGVFASGQSESKYPYKFKSSQNDITIKYIGISNLKPDKNFYRYKLLKKGHQAEWKYTDSREIVFSNLEPGTYNVLLSARNYKNTWSQPKTISFYIKAGLIQMVWFQVLLVVIAIILIVVAIHFRIKFLKRAENEKLQLKQMENMYTEAALSSLKSQINPHFIFNALQSVQGYILRNETSLANEYLNKFSKLIRSGLLYSTLEFIAVEEEKEFLIHYLDIEKLRFPNRFIYSLQVDERLIIENVKMPPLMLQPFCENAVKHAFEEDSLNNKIEVELCLDDSESFIHCTIKDNGIGFKNSKKKSTHASKGISLVEHRINLLVQKYGIGSLTIDNEHGTEVKITLPIE